MGPWGQPTEEELLMAQAEGIGGMGPGMRRPQLQKAIAAPNAPPPLRSLDQLLADEAFMESMNPQDAQQRALDKRMAMSQGLMGSQMHEKRTSALGKALAGIGDIINVTGGREMADEADTRQGELDAQAKVGTKNRALLSRATQADKEREQRERDAARAAAEMAERQAQNTFAAGETDKRIGADDKRAAADRHLKRELEGVQRQRDADKAKADAEGKKTEAQKKIEHELRGQLLGNQQTKDLQQVIPFFKQIVEAPNNPTGDTSRIYGLSKVYDPGGRVTQGDYEAAAGSGGPMGLIGGALKQLNRTGKLDERTRKEIEGEARRITGDRVKVFRPFESNFRKWAEQNGADPSNVLAELGIPEEFSAAPAAGRPGGQSSGGLSETEAAKLRELEAKWGPK